VFTIRLDGIALTYSTTDGSTPTARDAIATDVIALALKNLIEAQSLLSAYTVEQFGSVLHIYRTDGTNFSIDTGDGLADNGLRVVKDQVQLFVDLPTRAAPGFVVEVVGEPLSQADNYFLEFKNGLWQECPKPGSLVSLLGSKMPHRLILGRDLLPHLISEGFPGRPVVQAYGDDPVAVLIGKEVDGDTQDVGDDLTERGSLLAELEEHDCIFASLDTLTGAPATVTVNYDLWNLLDAGDVAWVKIYESDLTTGSYGSRVWTEKASKEYSSPGSFPNQSLSYVTAAAAGTDIRIAVIYDDDVVATTFRHTAIQVHAKTEPLPGVTVTLANDAKVVFPPELYPQGTKFTLTLDNGTPEVFDYTLASDMLGQDVADALRLLVDASTDYSATALATGSFQIEATPYDAFTFTIVDDFDEDTRLYNPLAGLSASSLVGGTIYNMSDGSSGVITANTESTITVTALTGGTTNSFGPGDSARVEAASPNDFIFQAVSWIDREAGDLSSNPYPHFIGKAIAALTFHHGRLGLISEDSVTFSESADYRRLHRRWVSVEHASAAFSFRVPSDQKLNFFAATEWDGRLVLWDDKEQKYLTSGEQIFSGSTVSARPFTRYLVSKGCKPLVQGAAIYFTRGPRVYELGIRGEASQPVALDITEHCPRYIDGNPLLLSGDATLGVVTLLTSSRNTINVCFQPNLPRERHYSWGKWDFQDDAVVGASISDGTLVLVIQRPDGLYLETLAMDAGHGCS
jgi:hypothetical protein